MFSRASSQAVSPRALKPRPSFVGKNPVDLSGSHPGHDHTQRGADTAGGNRACIAVSQHPGTLTQVRAARLGHRAIGADIVRRESHGRHQAGTASSTVSEDATEALHPLDRPAKIDRGGSRSPRAPNVLPRCPCGRGAPPGPPERGVGGAGAGPPPPWPPPPRRPRFA